MGLAPSFKSGVAFVEQPVFGLLLLSGLEYCHRMYCFQLRRSPMLRLSVCGKGGVPLVSLYVSVFFFFKRNPESMNLNLISSQEREKERKKD